MLNVLHIAAHLGGGIGTAYYGILSESRKQGSNDSHTFLLTEEPIDLSNIEKIESLGVKIHIHRGEYEKARELLIKADIVVINWWHHPSLYKFLIEFDDILCRTIIWSHVSGCVYPYLNVKFLDLCDKLVFTTPYSNESVGIADLDPELVKRKTEVIYGLGDYSQFINIEKQSHENFNIGYIGTVNYAKIHPQIEKYCGAVDVEDAIFTFVGRDGVSETISNRSLLSKMNFVGYTSEPWNYLARFDVFGYLLSPAHYGTTENALIEAMAAGVVPVALNQNVEKYLIENGVNGFLVDSPEKYGEVIRYLYEHPGIRVKMGQCAREAVLGRFSIRSNALKFRDICRDVSCLPKRKRPFTDVFSNDPFGWFLFGMDSLTQEKMQRISEQNDVDAIVRSLPEIFYQNRKSSVFHFFDYYPECDELAGITKKLKETAPSVF